METIVLGFNTLLEPSVLAFLTLGVFCGLVIGSIPGLNENIAFAVFLPFSFSMPPNYALALMVGVYCSAAVGGAMPAVMIKVPGTASAVLTAIDGNAMVKNGKVNIALRIAIWSSVFGGLTSAMVLLFFAPMLAAAALKFGYVENFSLCILGIAAVVGMMEKNVLKGVLSAAFGLLVATAGLSTVTGFPRFTYGISELYEGVPFVPLLVGLFGVSAAFELAEEVFQERRLSKDISSLPRISGSLIPTKSMIKRLLPTWISSSLIGNVVGVLPGAGMLMAIYIAYNQASNRYRRKFEGQPGEVPWGEGTPEGIAAPESANNAVVASSMVPLLSLGIPGNSVSALFIGALMIHGMVPGPLLFINHPDIAWMIMVAFFAANIIMGPVAILNAKYISGMVYRLPKQVMVPTIALLCLTGAFANGNSLFNVGVALGAGLVGYFFRKVGIPHAPIILALVLGQKLEDSMVSALNISSGSWYVFVDPVNHPISLVLIVISAFFTFLPIYKMFQKWFLSRKTCSVSGMCG